MRYLLLFAPFLFILACQAVESPVPVSAEPVSYDKSAPVETHGLGKAWLSEYGFFTGRLADLQPAAGVLPYALNAPLFSDYTEKARFLHLPPGTAADYHASEVLEFPVGTTIIKNFYYTDHAADAPQRRILETRLLVRQADEWQPLSYIWDEAQTDAKFSILGATLPAAWTEVDGTRRAFDYAVPDLNQCKSCHARDGETHPIGPSARQLNGDFAYAHGTQNQLNYLAAEGHLTNLPEAATLPRLASYTNATAPLTGRARAYLDANCGHCHRPEGSAKTSGLDLLASATDAYRLGIRKPPVAAGKASGDRRYSIVPGRPDESILLYRMEHSDPEIAMPELGRQLVHEEGVALIREWIAGL